MSLSDAQTHPAAALATSRDLTHMREPTARQWAFILAYSKSNSAADAYIAAGYAAPSRERASNAGRRLLKSPHVKCQIDIIQEQAIKASLVSIASLSDEYEQARGLAMDVESPGAAVSATTGKAKLHGLLVDRSETKTELSVSFEGASEFLLNALGQRAIQGGVGKKLEEN